MTPFKYVTPDRMDCHTATGDIAPLATAHGWHAVGWRDLAGSDTPGRIDEILVIRSPGNDVEAWLMMHDIDGDGVAASTWWRIPGRPGVEDLQPLRNMIRELGVINLRTVA